MMPSVFVLICIVSFVYLLYVAYSVFIYGRFALKAFLHGVFVGMAALFIFYIAMVLAKSIGYAMAVSYVIHVYAAVSIVGNLAYFAAKRVYEGMGMLVSLPLSAVLVGVVVLAAGLLGGL